SESSATAYDPHIKTCFTEINKTEVPSHIEHSLLNPDISKEKIVEECFLAKKYGFANVCVSPYYVSLAAEILRGSSVAVCAPVGFPHGAASTAAKLCEIRECMKNGATELDIALNILAIKSGEIADARADLEQMVATAAGKAKVKAIYEQSLYTEEEKKIVLGLILSTGSDYVKISNALSGKPAKEEDVLFVRTIVGRNVGIKIDGGIKSLQRAIEVLQSGADRIGLSASVSVAKEAYAK
ncbi:MAG: deoxyribose-phosphate aldolase, partial [Eubacteriales bacterium]